MLVILLRLLLFMFLSCFSQFIDVFLSVHFIDSQLILSICLFFYYVNLFYLYFIDCLFLVRIDF